MFSENNQILIENLENYHFSNAKSGHSPVEEFKTQIQLEFRDSSNVSIFKRHRVCMGTLNEPDRPAVQLQVTFPDENIAIRCINTLKLIKRFYIFQSFSFKNHRKFFRYYSESNVGQPRKFSFPRNFISDTGIRHSYYRSSIQKLVTSNTHSVLEIGAGFGGLCNLLLKDGKIDSYFIVDLPENLLLQHFYLHENEHQVLPWKARASRDAARPCIFLLNGDEILELDCQIELLINTMSMQHMSKMNLDFYFEQINRLDVKSLYLVNRNVIRDESDVKMENYPIPDSYCNTFLKTVFGKNHLESLHRRKN
jgi:putative sugar O-methyltransferase